MLTPKRENFCLAYIETGNASEAYRRAYNAGNMKPETINKRASELLANGEVKGRLNELRGPAVSGAQMTLEGHLADLKSIRDKALAAENFSAAVAAETSRGKAAGLYVDRLKLTDERSRMTDEELQDELVRMYQKFGIDVPGYGLTH